VERTIYEMLLGTSGYARLVSDPASMWLSTSTLLVLGLALLALVGYVLLRGPLEIQLLLGFGAMILTAGLVFPTTHPSPIPWWQAFPMAGSFNRYYLPLIFALTTVLLWLAAQRPTIIRIAGLAVLASSLVLGVVPNWREPPLLDYDFPRFVRRYERAPSGTRVQIPYPPGWSMVLTKP
jgi:hypothetical protein